MKYRPRRQSKRWLDGDCPDGVLAIYDDPNFTDRYTVFYRTPISGDNYNKMMIGYRGMSDAPASPNGVGIYGEFYAWQVSTYRCMNRHRACRWSTLPQAVQACVRRDLEELAELKKENGE